MPNPFRKPGSKKMNDPASICPLNKAQILVEVYSFDPRNPGNRTPMDGVGIAVTGGTSAKPAKTVGGRWRFQPLSANTYTVTPTFTAEQNDKFDTAQGVPVNQAVVAGDAPTVVILVPSTWVEFMVESTAVPAVPLARVPWVLEREPGGGVYARYDEGITDATGQVLRLGVGTGNHKLKVRELTNPTWSAAQAVIGTAITLAADVEGFNTGEAGVFEILEVENLNNVLQAVPATVKAGELQAVWKPTEGPMATLLRSGIVFRAKAKDAIVYSAPIMLKKKEVVKFATARGTAVNRQVTLRFVSGHTETFNTAGGQADVFIPWGETLMGATFPGLLSSRVKVEGRGVLTV